MLKAIAIDDEPPALKVIEAFCRRTETGEGTRISLEKTFTNPAEALRHFRKFPVDLLFLDINMPTMSGIDFYKSIEQDTMVIFTTAYSDYAVEGFNLSAVDYLLKPYSFERFMQAVNKAGEFHRFMHQSDKSESNHLLVRADYSLLKINISDIELVEGLDDYLKIHVAGQKPVVTRMTMKNIVEKLPAKNFVRIHRSFIVPLARISSVRNKTVYIGSHEIPIGGSYEQSFFEVFNK